MVFVVVLDVFVVVAVLSSDPEVVSALLSELVADVSSDTEVVPASLLLSLGVTLLESDVESPTVESSTEESLDGVGLLLFSLSLTTGITFPLPATVGALVLPSPIDIPSVEPLIIFCISSVEGTPLVLGSDVPVTVGIDVSVEAGSAAISVTEGSTAVSVTEGSTAVSVTEGLLLVSAEATSDGETPNPFSNPSIVESPVVLDELAAATMVIQAATKNNIKRAPVNFLDICLFIILPQICLVGTTQLCEAPVIAIQC